MAHAVVSRKMVTADEAQQLQQLEKLITVNKIDDITAFKDACKPVYDKYTEKYGDKIQLIREAQ
jgi:TRAP-type C4-dicarboxylate transport system substrate-binding protein